MWDDKKKFWFETARKTIFGIAGFAAALWITSVVQASLDGERLVRNAEIAEQTEIITEYISAAYELRADQVAFSEKYYREPFDDSQRALELDAKRYLFRSKALKQQVLAEIHFSSEVYDLMVEHHTLLEESNYAFLSQVGHLKYISSSKHDWWAEKYPGLTRDWFKIAIELDNLEAKLIDAAKDEIKK